MNDMNDNEMNDIETRLRETLADRAHRAPPGAALGERIVLQAALLPAPARVRRAWQTWTLPVIAASAVAAIAITLVVVENTRTTSGHHQAATPAPTHTSGPTNVPSSPHVSPSPSTSLTGLNHNPLGLTNFVVSDVTFVGPNTGWALGTADCLSGSGTCTAMAQTTDGRTWHSVKNPPVNIGATCTSDKCASNIRFANPSTGYVFGQDILFMTTDGGTHWSKQDGGAYALETLDNNVIRLVADHSGCPGPCNLRVQYSDIGSAKWTTVSLPGAPVDTGSVTLMRTGSSAFVVAQAGHAGSSVPALLFASLDDGHNWVARANPCAKPDTFLVGFTTAADGSLSVVCLDATAQTEEIMTSTDDGATFLPGSAFGPGHAPVGTFAAASSEIFIGRDGSGIYRTTNRGKTWTLTQADSANGPGLCGFQTATVARCLTDGDRGIFTTHDAGATWIKVTFS